MYQCQFGNNQHYYSDSYMGLWNPYLKAGHTEKINFGQAYTTTQLCKLYENVGKSV